jgi:oligoribonuclease NrnB/cAMP/cGMP phosphodiesterase (DHH superfamily)
MSIPHDALSKVSKVIVHANCPDGLASAMILKQALNQDIEFIQYKTDAHANIPAVPGLLFCDFTPPRERVQEFVDAGAIVLDHHKGAQDIVAQFGELGVFADEKSEPGVSGATLAYREVWLPIVAKPDILVEDFAVTAGIRDTWQTKDPRWVESCEQSSWLMFFGAEELLKPPIFGDQEKWDFRVSIGKLLFEEHMRKVKKTVDGAYRTSVHGLRVMIHQGVSHTSDAAEMMGEESKVDILAGFSYFAEDGTEREDWSPEFGDNLKLVVSTRTRTNFDVSKLAKFYGGGGHTKAAGFNVKVTKLQANPYAHILALIDDYWFLQGHIEQTVEGG